MINSKFDFFLYFLHTYIPTNYLSAKHDEKNISENLKSTLEPDVVIIRNTTATNLPSTSRAATRSSSQSKVYVKRDLFQQIIADKKQNTSPTTKSVKRLRQFYTEKPFTCSSCSKSYTTRSNLSRHMRVECGREPKFICPICKTKYYYRCSLVHHAKVSHKFIFKECA